MLRRALAVAMSVLLSTPVWATSNPLGTLASGRDVTVAGAAAANGSTVYSGDTLSVSQDGNASMILSGGARARMAGSSQARLSRDGSAIALELLNGQVEFTSNGKSPVVGHVADVTIRPENPSSPSVAFMTLNRSNNHTVLYANRGAWIVTTAHDGHSLILQPGTHIEGMLTAVQNQNPQDTVQGQQNKKKKRKWGVIWIGTGIIGAATGLGMAFGMSECNVANGPGCVSNTNPGQTPPPQ